MKAEKKDIIITKLQDGSFLCELRNNDILHKMRYMGSVNKAQAKRYFISHLSVEKNIIFNK